MLSATLAFREALEAGESEGLAEAVRRFQRCLEAIGVVPQPIREAVRRLERAGAAAKISGAGALGGAAAGCLLVYSGPAPAAAPARWRSIDCAMGGPGLRLEAA